MTQSTPFTLSGEEYQKLKQLRASVADFRALIAALPGDERSPEHNQQFNHLRLETMTLLKGQFSEEIPKAITGDVTTDRSISMIVILGVLLALGGLGVNSVILEDFLINSLACCVSGGGMLLVMGAFGVLTMKNVRERVSDIETLRQRCDLLLYQIDHRLKMTGISSGGHSAHTQDMAPLPPEA